jgi:23S rRNA pseudouridine955/2504/2580 synthase
VSASDPVPVSPIPVSEVQSLTVAEAEADQRLDRWFKRRFPALTHGRLEKLLRTGQVRVDGKRVKASSRLAAGQVVRVPPLGASALPEARRPAASRPRLSAEDKDFVQSLVIYRDDDMMALNKPPGLAVQGGTGTERHLDFMLDGLRFEGGERPRLVHRLDKDTSGVLLLGRTAHATASLGEAFREKSTRKIYWALTVGLPRPFQGKIDLALAKLPGKAGERMAPDPEKGKRAVTYYRVIEQLGQKAAWVALWPVTGRTHQLRVHMAEIGTPIQGDGKYGGKDALMAGDGLSRKLHLHARGISLPHPRTGLPVTIVAPLPTHMRGTWKLFGLDAEMKGDPFEEIEV